MVSRRAINIMTLDATFPEHVDHDTISRLVFPALSVTAPFRTLVVGDTAYNTLHHYMRFNYGGTNSTVFAIQPQDECTDPVTKDGMGPTYIFAGPFDHVYPLAKHQCFDRIDYMLAVEPQWTEYTLTDIAQIADVSLNRHSIFRAILSDDSEWAAESLATLMGARGFTVMWRRFIAHLTYEHEDYLWKGVLLGAVRDHYASTPPPPRPAHKYKPTHPELIDDRQLRPKAGHQTLGGPFQPFTPFGERKPK
jgi:hypothetical protein